MDGRLGSSESFALHVPSPFRNYYAIGPSNNILRNDEASLAHSSQKEFWTERNNK